MPREALKMEHQKRALVEDHERRVAELKRESAEKEAQGASMLDEFEKTGLVSFLFYNVITFFNLNFRRLKRFKSRTFACFRSCATRTRSISIFIRSV